MFDDEHLVSYAGLVPVMTLAEQTGLLRLLGEKVHIAEPRIKSAAANPSPKLATVVPACAWVLTASTTSMSCAVAE